MNEFFAHLYEWFGLVHLYSQDLRDFMRGWDIACSGYYTTPWFMYIGLVMITLTILIFALQYDLISATRFKKWTHWELSALLALLANFCLAFAVPFVAIETGLHCPRLVMTLSDCFFFGFSNALWSLLLFVILSALQRIRVTMSGK